MELFSILLSILLSSISPAGYFIDTTAENAIRNQFNKVEQLQVRVDNVPTHQLIQGKIDRVQIAGRGFWLTENFRIDTLEIETDPSFHPHVNFFQLHQVFCLTSTGIRREVILKLYTTEHINPEIINPVRPEFQMHR